MQQKHEYFVIQYQCNKKNEDILKMMASQALTSQVKCMLLRLNYGILGTHIPGKVYVPQAKLWHLRHSHRW